MVAIGTGEGGGDGRRDARGHHRGGNQYPLSNRQHAYGRRRARVDPGDEEGGRGGGRSGNQIPGPLAQREAARAGDRLCSPQQEREGPAENEGRLQQTAGGDQPGSGTGKKVLRRDRRATQKRRASRITESQTATRRDDSARAAGDEAGARTSPAGKYAGEEQDPQRV